MRRLLILFLMFVSLFSFGQKTTVKLAVLRYRGGGNWYVNPTALPNLARFCNEKMGTNIALDAATVDPGSPEIFNYPFVHITGNGNIIFSEQEAENLRNYLISGGFLEISDSYGLDKYIRREMKKVFPDKDFVELPASHPIFHQFFDFPNGLPKIHRHDNKRPQGFGIFYNGRLVVFYDYECDLGDGWCDPQVYHDSEYLHEQALKMGANIISYVFTNP